MFDFISAIVEAIFSLVGSIIEGIASIFTSAGVSLGAGEAVATGSVYVIELFAWLLIFLFELILALFLLRKPKKVSKPVIWRKGK